MIWPRGNMGLEALTSLAINRYVLSAPALSSKLAARRCCYRSTVQTDGRTYGGTDTAHTMHRPTTHTSKSRLALHEMRYTAVHPSAW